MWNNLTQKDDYVMPLNDVNSFENKVVLPRFNSKSSSLLISMRLGAAVAVNDVYNGQPESGIPRENKHYKVERGCEQKLN